jgi:hypothetical protein
MFAPARALMNWFTEVRVRLTDQVTSPATGAMMIAMPAASSQRRTPAVADPLATVIDKAKVIELDASRTEVDKRYALAKLAYDVRKNPTKYGEKGIARLAKALGRDRSSLYRASNLASYWTHAEVKKHARKAGKNGLGITWSHLELVADEKNAKKREQLLLRITEEGLSVRELKRAVRPPKVKVELADAPNAQAGIITAITKSVFELNAKLARHGDWPAEVGDADQQPVAVALKELAAQLETLQELIMPALNSALGVQRFHGKRIDNSEHENKPSELSKRPENDAGEMN